MPGNEDPGYRRVDEWKHELGDLLRRMREQCGMTLRELSRAIGYNSDGHLSNVEQGRSVPSMRLIALWVEQCGGDIAPLYALREDIERADRDRRGQPAVHSRQTVGPESFYDPPEPGRLYTVVTSEMRFTMDSAGAGTEVYIGLAIKARLHGVDRYYTGWAYNGNTDRGVVEIVPDTGCRVGEFQESEVGSLNGYFHLERPLSPDDPEPYQFSFRVLLTTNKRAIPPTIGQFRADAARHAVRVKFTPPALPRHVWWFDVETALQLDDDPSAEFILPLDPSGHYFHEFVRPRAGRIYGINWHWAQVIG